MQIRDEDIQTLKELGLTLLQAKTYLALSASGNATIKTIAKNTRIAKHDVYRIMPSLQELGLVEKMVSTPVIYKAAPMENATSKLLQNKTHECTNLQKKTADLVSYFRNNSFHEPVQEEDSQFRIISEKLLLLKTLDDATDNVQYTIDIMHAWGFTSGMLLKHDPGVLKRAMKRGARIRWITEIHKEDKQAEKILSILTKNPLFEIRYYRAPIPIRTAIYDKKEAAMGLSHLPEDWAISMWSNNRMFVKIVTNYYEQIWNSASKDNSEKTAESSNNETAT